MSFWGRYLFDAPKVIIFFGTTKENSVFLLFIIFLYLASKATGGRAVVVPCRLLVQLVAVGAQEADAAQAVYVLRHGDAPPDVTLVPCARVLVQILQHHGYSFNILVVRKPRNDFIHRPMCNTIT